MQKFISVFIFVLLMASFCGFEKPAANETVKPYADDYVCIREENKMAYLSFQNDCDVTITIENGKIASVQTAMFGESTTPDKESKPIPMISYNNGQMVVPLIEDGTLFLGVEDLGAGFSAGVIGFYY